MLLLIKKRVEGMKKPKMIEALATKTGLQKLNVKKCICYF